MSMTINHTNAYLKSVTGHMPLNSSGRDMCRFIVSRGNSDYRALILLAGQRRQKRQKRIKLLSPKHRQRGRYHPCSFLHQASTHQMRRWVEIRPRNSTYILVSCSFNALCMKYQVLCTYLLETGEQMTLPYNYIQGALPDYVVWHDNDYDLPYVWDYCRVIWWGLIK